MRALPDRWNPRVWLRDWLLRPTVTERALRDRIQAKRLERVRQNLAAMEAAEAAASDRGEVSSS